ncbi:tyrosinase family protein [Sinorhizobium meliloti]|nr:tyrosinase family protein [Sinorhizobium meliloti]
MDECYFESVKLSRRGLLRTAAAMGATVLPFGSVQAQTTAKFSRRSVTDPAAAPALESYKKAIRAMLSLPPEDPRNWYRLALVHTVDCPHGNWWFLPWHRGYVGWFERICRELSGDPEFALPYWDWTAEQRVPAVMFDDVLTPTNSAFIGGHDDFKRGFQEVVARSDMWKRVHTDGAFDDRTQYGQLLARGIRFPEDLWFDINDDPRGKFFFDLTRARGLSAAAPAFDARTVRAVSTPRLLDALAPRDFLTFASPKTFSHSGLTGYGVLEGQPHNLVHLNVGGITAAPVGEAIEVTDVGGFMQANMSPVDPLFYLHHANIDRLWDVWTRKQQARQYPTLPDGYLIDPPPRLSDFARWRSEPFLFFIDEKGEPVSKVTAGDYAAIGDFDYTYTSGAGEDVVEMAVAAARTAGPARAVQRFTADVSEPSANAIAAVAGLVRIPPALLAAGEGPNAVKLFAKVTVALSPLAHPRDLAVLVNAPDDSLGATPDSASFAGQLAMFGHHTIHCPVTWTVPLSGPIEAQRASNVLNPAAPVSIRVVANPSASAHAMATSGEDRPPFEVLSIVVEAH